MLVTYIYFQMYRQINCVSLSSAERQLSIKFYHMETCRENSYLYNPES